MEKSLDISIRMKNGEFAIEVSEPESGESSLICPSGCSEAFPFSPDEHPEFDKAIGNEIYSWLSLWADELAEDADGVDEPSKTAEEPQRSDTQPEKFATTFPAFFIRWKKLDAIADELAKDYFSSDVKGYILTGEETEEIDETDWGIVLQFPERTDRLFKRFEDLCSEYDRAGFLDPKTEWPTKERFVPRDIILPKDISLRMLGDYIATLKGVERSFYNAEGVYFLQTGNSADLYLQNT